MTAVSRRALWALTLILLAIALFVILRNPADERIVRFVLYRSAVAQFYLDRGAAPGASLDYAHNAKDTVPFGVPGDIGLVCPQKTPETGRGYRVFINGWWFMSGDSFRAPQPDLVLGQAGDLPFCADFDGDGVADSGIFHDGAWLIATKRHGADADIRFALGAPGDRPVVVNVDGAGNATDRKSVVYGVYRQGTWYLDTKGDGEVDATHTFGGLAQDVPLLIPRWAREPGTGRGYSLAIFRDGTWYIKPDPDGTQTLSFGFGQAGDLPGVSY